MKKLVRDLLNGDRVELLDNTIGIVDYVIIGDRNNALVCYKCGRKTFALPDEQIQIL